MSVEGLEILKQGVVAANRREPRPLRCGYCVKNWIEKGRNPEEKPMAYPPAALPDKCPTCGNIFRSIVA